jgi:hypothetical protein
MEQTISSWVAIDWKDEMTREELLVARIRQLQWRPEDVEQAAKKLRAARVKNKERFDRTHRLRPKKIKEGDWVLVYDSSLDNQHKATRKFARRWFGPYIVTSAKNSGYRKKPGEKRRRDGVRRVHVFVSLLYIKCEPGIYIPHCISLPSLGYKRREGSPL